MKEHVTQEDWDNLWIKAATRMDECGLISALDRELALTSNLLLMTKQHALIRTRIKALTNTHCTARLEKAMRVFWPGIVLIVEHGETENTPSEVFRYANNMANAAINKASKS